MTELPHLTRALLASYPPSFKERYGAEQAALIEEAGFSGTSFDLARGSLRAWLQPRFGAQGPQWQRNRITASVSTLWVMWVLAFFGGAAWNRAVNDPPIYAIGTTWGWSLYHAASVAFTIGVISVAVIVAVVFGYVVVTAARSRNWEPLRRLMPFAVLTVIEMALLVAIGTLRYNSVVTRPSGYTAFRGFPLWYVGLLLLWLVLLIPLMITGMRGPVVALRAATIPVRALRIGYWAATIPVVALAVTTMASVWFLIAQSTHGRLNFWGTDQYSGVVIYDVLGVGIQIAATAGLVIVTLIALVSYVRGIRAASSRLETTT